MEGTTRKGLSQQQSPAPWPRLLLYTLDATGVSVVHGEIKNLWATNRPAKWPPASNASTLWSTCRRERRLRIPADLDRIDAMLAEQSQPGWAPQVTGAMRV